MTARERREQADRRDQIAIMQSGQPVRRRRLTATELETLMNCWATKGSILHYAMRQAIRDARRAR